MIGQNGGGANAWLAWDGLPSGREHLIQVLDDVGRVFEVLGVHMYGS
jgi:hypothetical protein